MRGFLLSFGAFLATLLLSAEGHAEVADDYATYAESLVQKAHESHLAEDPSWLRLGHYVKKYWRYRSEVDGPNFFLSEEGRGDPSAELDATIRGFFQAPEYEVGTPPSNPICRFPARLAFLAERLQFDAARLRMPKCPKFDEYWQKADPHSVTLVFSSFFISNPASAFGHTFLRINRGEKAGQTKHEELLDHGVDYSAAINTNNALVYGIKGLFGFFRGTFNMYPYYYKVREYNDYEFRDLWEYDLDLDRKQVVMLTAHLWELGSSYIDYYYIDENCSFHILRALEAVLPKVDITSKLRTVVIPADTVRTVMETEGLVARVRFRPSLRHVFEARVEGMASADVDMVERLANNVEWEFPEDLDVGRKIRIFDAALDLNDIRWAKELVHEEDTEGGRRKQRLLERRAEVGEPSPALDVPTRWNKAPHLSHGSGRVTLSGGFLSGTTGTPGLQAPPKDWGAPKGYVDLSWRVAGHDLTDPGSGQSDYSRVDFGHIGLRFYPWKQSLKGLEVTDVTLARVDSLSPLERFVLKPSWRVTTAAFRVRDRGCANGDCLVVGGGFGGGLTVGLFDDRLLVYGMAESLVMASGALRGIEDSPVRVDIGPTAGMRLRLGNSFRGSVVGHVGWLPMSNLPSTGTLESTVRWRLGQDAAVGLDAKVEPSAASVQLAGALYY